MAVDRALRKSMRERVFERVYYFRGDDDFLKESTARELIAAVLDPATRDFNLELIRVFLSDAKMKNKLVIGSRRTGWRLTQDGLRWAETAAKALGESDLSRSRAQSRSGGPEEQRRHRERDRLLKSAAWRMWKSGNQDIPVTEAKQVFRLDSYARGDLREAKITRLRDMFSDDPELTPFLDHLIDNLNRVATL